MTLQAIGLRHNTCRLRSCMDAGISLVANAWGWNAAKSTLYHFTVGYPHRSFEPTVVLPLGSGGLLIPPLSPQLSTPPASNNTPPPAFPLIFQSSFSNFFSCPPSHNRCPLFPIPCLAFFPTTSFCHFPSSFSFCIIPRPLATNPLIHHGGLRLLRLQPAWATTRVTS